MSRPSSSASPPRSHPSGLAERLAPTLTVAATYVYFLLFAQYGLVRLLGENLGEGAASAATAPSVAVKAAMAAMGVSGLLGSFGAARWLRKNPPIAGVRWGFGACALAAAIATWCRSTPAFVALSLLIGMGLATLTVSLATGLRHWTGRDAAHDGRGRFGLQIGLGTGLAYWFCNLPATFEGAPSAQCWISSGAALCGLACSFALRRDVPATSDRNRAITVQLHQHRYGGAMICLAAVAGFLALIWLDSAAFNVIQQTDALKGATWSGTANKTAMGLAHLVAAVLAGIWIDRGRYGVLQLSAFACFVVSFAALQSPAAAPLWAGPLYAVGISIYSTALVAFPGLAPEAAGLVPIRWRAAGVYGIGGWLGSALGVGMAQNLHRIPTAFLWAAGLLLAVGALFTTGVRPRRILLTGPLAIGAISVTGALAVHTLATATTGAYGPPEPLANEVELVAEGRRVYLAEGCINCHSQFLRPPREGAEHDLAWWGPMRPLDREERPPLPGNRRQGPDLKNAGNRRSPQWHRQHLIDPRSVSPGSRMPSYRHLFEPSETGNSTDPTRGSALVAYLASLGETTGEARRQVVQQAVIDTRGGDRQRGHELFATYCSACHGSRAVGDGELSGLRFGPATVRNMNLRKPHFSWQQPRATEGFPERATERSTDPAPALDQVLGRVVRFGRPDTSMPGHEWLTDREVADLVAFLIDLPGTADRSLPWESGP